MQMYNLGTSIPGPSGLGTLGVGGGGGGLDLYDNQEIMTNSSSLYDDTSNMPSKSFHQTCPPGLTFMDFHLSFFRRAVNPMYGKAYPPELLADGAIATPTSPSTHSSQQMANVIIKNPMSHLETASMDSGPPPLYHSVYSNFATWNHAKAPLDCSLQMAQPEDLLLMADVSTYYSGQGSPSHALVGMSASNAWNGGGSSLSVPFHQQPFDPNDMFTSNGTVLMATPHVSTSTTGAVPYLNGTVSLVDSSTSQGRFYSQQPHNETIIFESGQAQPIMANNGSFADSVRIKYTSLPGLIE